MANSIAVSKVSIIGDDEEAMRNWQLAVSISSPANSRTKAARG